MDKIFTEKRLKITARELDIINVLAKGYSNDEIGKELFMSVHTVKSHLESIYQKFGVKNRVQLIVYAFKNRLIE